MAHYEYDAFGRVIAENHASTVTPQLFSHRFSSKVQDLETGLNYYGYRYYSADLGRWLNRDPIEEEGGINIYQFCINAPVMLIDPLGGAAVSTVVGIGLGALGTGLGAYGLWWKCKPNEWTVPREIPCKVFSCDKGCGQVDYYFPTKLIGYVYKEENVGKFESCKAVLKKIVELRPCTPSGCP